MKKKSETTIVQSDPFKNGRPTIALLSGPLTFNKNKLIQNAAARAAKDNNINIIGFSGGYYNSNSVLSNIRYRLFEQFDPKMFDGVIIQGEEIFRYETDENIKIFLDNLKPLPIITIGGRFEGAALKMSEQFSESAQILEHLIEFHGYRRIALFRGPEKKYAPSQENMHVYIDTLKKFGIPVEDDLIVYNDTAERLTEERLDTLLEKYGGKIDAIISTKSRQAACIINALQRKGYKVPDDIAVASFQKTHNDLFSDPTVSSMSAPYYQASYQAVLEMMKLLKGDIPASPVITLPSTLALGNSCGCGLHSLIQLSFSGKPHTIDSNATQNTNRNDIISEILNDLIRTEPNFEFSKARPDIKKLIEEFADTLLNPENRTFLYSLESLFNITIDDVDLQLWQSAILIINKFALINIDGSSISNNYDEMFRLLNLFSYSIDNRKLAYRDYRNNYYNLQIEELSSILNAEFDSKSILDYMPEFRLSDCYISIFVDEKTNNSSKCVLGIRDLKLIGDISDEIIFPSKQLLPNIENLYNDICSLIVFPLNFRGHYYGTIVFDYDSNREPPFESIQSIISSTLRNFLQFRELNDERGRFSDIAHTASDWLWEIDNEFKFTYSSDGVNKVLGYTPDEIMGRTLFDFLLPSEQEYIRLVKEKLIPGRLPIENAQNLNRHKNGSEVCLLASAMPIISDDKLFGYRGAFRDVTKERYNEKKIDTLAYYDSLTGLPNRVQFNEKLHSTIIKSEQDDTNFALLFIDLDRFKYVNDKFGHLIGDQLLNRITKSISSCLSPGDFAARLSGDEFAVILPKIKDKQDAEDVAKKIVNKLASPVTIRNHVINCTASIGIVLHPIDGYDTNVLLKYADSAMYEAKKNGRNRYAFYNKDLEIHDSMRTAFEITLRKAIEDNNFLLLYQPIINSFAGQVLGVEALLRIDDPDMGIVMPNEFIPLAEEFGLIEQVGEWVLKQACSQINLWDEKGYSDLKISINISAMQFQDINLVDTFIGIINQHKIDLGRFIFEITEQAMIKNENETINSLTRFKEKGISIAFDDFGTGYSSLTYLKQFPIDKVKIDRSFVSDCLTNLYSAAIIKSVILMSKSLGLKVTAEGIETVDQLKYIQSLECDDLQGFLFSRPVEPDMIEKILKDNSYQDIITNFPSNITSFEI